MTGLVSLTIQARHQAELVCQEGRECAAYLLCGQANIALDPWTDLPRRKYLSFEVLSIPYQKASSSSSIQIWKNESFIRALELAGNRGMTVAVIHAYSADSEAYSKQDDEIERHLVKIAQDQNGPETRLLSLRLTPDSEWMGRCWINPGNQVQLTLVSTLGDQISLHYPDRGKGTPSPVFHRQALAFGNALTQDLSKIRVGVAGCGATGSATAMFLPKLGVRRYALFDKDVVEESNLNRLHGATSQDVQQQMPKVEIVERSLMSLGIDLEVRSYQSWINELSCREALKSCDVVFACTDDHAGRLFLNRFAYFYLTPVFDMGLAIQVSSSEPPEIQALDGRVTTLMPGCACLLCRGVINPVVAREESLKRDSPAEYERMKTEAYVVGEGDPSPSVVLFTTDLAIMALEEMVHRVQGFRGVDGAVDQRVRKYKLRTDRNQGAPPNRDCPICGSNKFWGRGDVEPFLDLV